MVGKKKGGMFSKHCTLCRQNRAHANPKGKDLLESIRFCSASWTVFKLNDHKNLYNTNLDVTGPSPASNHLVTFSIAHNENWILTNSGSLL